MFRKYFADLNRVCEVEDTVVEWFQPAYVRQLSLKSHISRTFDPSTFEEHFSVLNIEVGGIDFSVWRVLLKAKNVQGYKYY